MNNFLLNPPASFFFKLEFVFQKFDKQELHELQINGFSELCESENVKCTETKDGWHIKGALDSVMTVKEEVAKILSKSG